MVGMNLGNRGNLGGGKGITAGGRGTGEGIGERIGEEWETEGEVVGLGGWESASDPESTIETEACIGLTPEESEDLEDDDTGRMDWEELVLMRINNIQVGDTWKNWTEMAKELMLVDPDRSDLIPVKTRTAVNAKIAKIFEYETEGRLIRVTSKNELPDNILLGIIHQKRAREGTLDSVLAGALLREAESPNPFHKRLESSSVKLSKPIKNYVDSLKGTDREVIILQMTTMQIIKSIGVSCYPEKLESTLVAQTELKEIQSQAEKRFLSHYVKEKVWNKSKSVVEGFLERMEKRFYIVMHKGFLFEYTNRVGKKWNIPSVEEAVLLNEAKAKTLRKYGCKTEAEIRGKMKFKDYKDAVLEQLKPMQITNYCSVYQLAFQKSTLALFLGKRSSDLPTDRDKLLREFMSSFYKSDRKYMEKQEKLWGLVSQRDLSDAILAAEYMEMVEEGIDISEIKISNTFEPSCSLVRENFAEKNKQLYQEYLQ